MERDLSRDTAERLLGGDLSPPPDGAERLAALLAAASAPGRPDELVGEAAAMAAFRAHPPTVRRWSLRRAVTIKVAAVVAVTVAAGGVAVAGGSGLLPFPFLPDNLGPIPSTSDGPSGRPGGHGRSANPVPSAPDEKLVKDCLEFKRRTEDDKRKELKGSRFEYLVKEAGAPEHVDAFCDKVLAVTPSASKSNDQGNSGNGTPGTPGVPGSGATSGNQGDNNQSVGPATPGTSPSVTHGRPNPMR